MDRKMLGAVSILAVCAVLFAGAAVLAPQSEAAATDYNELITTSDLTLDPYLNGLQGSRLTEAQRFDEKQAYSGKSVSAVTWSGMAKGATVTLPVYLPGTTQAIADVAVDKTYKGSYYLCGWATSPGKTSGAGFYAAGESYEITDTDTRLYAVWAKAAGGSLVYHDEDAPSTGQVGVAYDYKPVTYSSVKDSDNTGWVMILEAWGTASQQPSAASKPSWMTCSITNRSQAQILNVAFSSAPTAPGNYYVEIVTSGSPALHVWWVVSVPGDDTQYTYSYDTGLSTGSTPSGGTARYGQTFVLSDGFVGGTEIAYTDDSMTLAGWYLQGSSGTSAFFRLGQLVSMYEITSFASNGKLTFRADWKAADGVVVLSMDGASLKNVDAYVASRGEVITLPVPYDSGTQAQLQKQDSTLIGWNTLTQSESTNGSGLWAPGSMVRMDSGVLKAEAYWYPTSQLSSLKTVTFDPNGGSYGSAFTGTQKVPSGWFAYLPQYGLTAPTGMKLAGWAESENASADDIITADSVKVSSDIILYAVWIEDSDPSEDTPTYYRVYFNTNGGKGSASVQVIKEGGYARQPTGITKDGYIIEGWTDANGKQWDFSADTVKGDTTLTAKWALHWTYAVDHLKVTITVSEKYDRSVYVDWGDNTSDTKLEHTYASVNASSLIRVSSYASGSASDTMYSSYRTLTGLEGEFVPQTEMVTVTFNAQPGKFPDGSAWRQVEIEKGTTVSEPTDIPVYDDEHVFSHWRYGTVEFDFDQKIYAETVLYVQWSDVYITSFNPCYDGAATIPSVKTPAGDSLTLPSAGTRDGYVFAGWYTMRSGGGTYVGDVGSSYEPPSSRTLYAYWKTAEKDVEVTVKFTVGMGTAIEDMTVKLGEEFELPSSVWTGHDLIAWYKVSEKVGAPGVKYAPTENCTLTAQWLDTSSGETVDRDDFIIPGAAIAIEEAEDGSGWTLIASGKNAVSYQWSVSSDGKKHWSDLGTEKEMFLPASDYAEPGTYHVQLTTTSSTGHTNTVYDSFTVGGDDDGDGGIVSYLMSHPAATVGLVIGILVLIFVTRWYL